MPIEKAWPSLLSHKLNDFGKQISVVNGSISGDTTGNGLARLPALLRQHNPDTVLVELGANDGLRGFPPDIITRNLGEIIDTARSEGTNVILMQIRVPPNYGKRYSDAFYNVYPEIARKKQVTLIPFFLEQIIIKPEWMMADGLHPKAEAQPWIAGFIAEHISDYL